MKLNDFKVERYFAKYEFTAKYLLSSSDCDGCHMKDVLSLASPDETEQWNNLTLGYIETVGSEPLRQAIKQHYQQIELDEILVSSPGEANFILMNVLLNAGDQVICMSPMYQSMYQVAKDLGAAVSFWLPSQSENNWHFNPDDLDRMITPATKLIVINFPHNPTGFSPTMEEYKQIISIAQKHNIVLFSDEMYRFLNHDPNAALPAASDLYENAISLWGTSKTFGLAGLRLGWLTSKNKAVLKKVERFKDYLSICNSATSEILATIALNNLEKLVNPNLEKIKTNLLLFDQFCKRQAHFFRFLPPNSGSTAFVKLNINEPAMVFAEKVVKDTGIMLLPSETFEFGNKHIRIGFGRKNMNEVLGIFENYLTN